MELRFDLLRWQRSVFEDKTRYQVVVAGRRCGKTRMSAVKTLVKAVECPVEDAGVMYVAPTFGMARTIMWDLLIGLAGKLVASSNVNNGEIKLINGRKIYIRGADNPDALRGVKLYYVVVDEMKDIKPSTWELILRPALTDMKGGALFIGTPEPGESLFRTYFDLGISGKDPEWKSWHFTTMDNELIDPEEIEAARRTMSTMAFRQEYEASFDTMGADIFKEEWFKSGPEPRDGDYYIAVDLAGFEDVSDPNKKKHLDDTAIAVVKITDDGKWWVKKVDGFRKDVRETAVRIMMAIRTYKPIMVGIEKGALQRAVMPYLTDLMHKHAIYAHIELISTSGSTKKGSDAIANRVIYNLQGRFEHGMITFSDTENHSKLKEQLLMFPSPRMHDDCFPGDAPIVTKCGVKRIDEVTTNDYVLTRFGFRKVLRAWCVGNRKVISRFGITATPEHRIYTENRGWISLDSLCKTDILIQCKPIKDTSCEKQLDSMEGITTGTQTQNRVTIENTTRATISGKELHDCCTEMCGNSVMAKSQMDTTSIIRTETSTTTPLKTSNAYQESNILWSISKVYAKGRGSQSTLNTSRESGRKQRHGTHLQKEENGIDFMQNAASQKTCQKNHAKCAGNCLSQELEKRSSALKNARGQEETIYREKHGEEKTIPVYDLTVDEHHEFFAYGVLVHNCADALSLIANLHNAVYGKFDDSADDFEVIDEIVGF